MEDAQTRAQIIATEQLQSHDRNKMQELKESVEAMNERIRKLEQSDSQRGECDKHNGWRTAFNSRLHAIETRADDQSISLEAARTFATDAEEAILGFVDQLHDQDRRIQDLPRDNRDSLEPPHGLEDSRNLYEKQQETIEELKSEIHTSKRINWERAQKAEKMKGMMPILMQQNKNMQESLKRLEAQNEMQATSTIKVSRPRRKRKSHACQIAAWGNFRKMEEVVQVRNCFCFLSAIFYIRHSCSKPRSK